MSDSSIADLVLVLLGERAANPSIKQRTDRAFDWSAPTVPVPDPWLRSWNVKARVWKALGNEGAPTSAFERRVGDAVRRLRDQGAVVSQGHGQATEYALAGAAQEAERLFRERCAARDRDAVRADAAVVVLGELGVEATMHYDGGPHLEISVEVAEALVRRLQ